jgi:hypothetical protein
MHEKDRTPAASGGEGGDVVRNVGWRAWGREGVASGGGRRR